jgi:hypothetical protein
VEKRVLGDAALALDTYRTATWNPGNVYPWMAAFRSPRAVATGVADSGSAVHLDQAAGNFVAKGVQVGDILVNIDDGSQGPITAVTPTRIDFEALAGGTENDVDPGENFRVEPSFRSTLDRDGQLPVHLRNQIFNTPFTATWDFTADPDPTVNPTEPPVLPLTPPLADMLTGAGYNFPNGRCMWSEPLRVDCTGSLVIGSYFRADLGINVARTVEVSFSFPGDSMVVTPPQPADVRRRDVTIAAAPLPGPVVVAAPLLPQVPWTVQITDNDGVSSVARTITMDANTNGSITVSGIRFDLSVVYDNVDDGKDELPEWFAENNWHHFIYAAISQDAVAGGNADLDGDCSTPTNTCLSLNVAGAASRTDIRGLLVSAGMEWTNQNRDIGDCDGDGGGPLADPMDDSFLCAYLDGDTSLYDVSIDVLHHGANTQTITADFFSRDVLSAGYNDQIRVIEPLPP